MMAIAFIILIVIVPPFTAWHYAGYFNADDNGETRYDRWSREEAERKATR